MILNMSHRKLRLKLCEKMQWIIFSKSIPRKEDNTFLNGEKDEFMIKLILKLIVSRPSYQTSHNDSNTPYTILLPSQIN